MVQAPPKPHAVETKLTHEKWEAIKQKYGLRDKTVHISSVWTAADGTVCIRVGPELVLTLPPGKTRENMFPPVVSRKEERRYYRSQSEQRYSPKTG